MPEGAKNLSVPRSGRNVWDEPRRRLGDFDTERLLMAAGGSGLAMLGGRRGGLAGGTLSILGGVLAARAAMGHHDLKVVRHWLNRALESRGWLARDTVGHASEESFPASDAPSWTGVD